MVMPEAGKPVLIQVTETLNKDNVSREIAGLEKAGKRFKNSTRLVVAGDVALPPGILPDRVEVIPVCEWVLKQY
nr:hypothetical protein [Desulfobacula sp.]